MARIDETPSADVDALLREMAAAPSIEPSSELFPLAEGTVVAQAYRVEARIGAGGMGVVYRATDLALGRPVALKLHRRRPEADRLDRLMREASVMARMSHPHVLTVYEVGHHRDDASGESRLFIAMEFVDGGSLVDWSSAHSPNWRATLDVFLQAGDGLAAAHRAGVVHRDFKPHNILIDENGRVRVADFGLARLGVDAAADVSFESSPSLSTGAATREGAVMGTPAYMAPEQWRGEAGTASSDQFAFCVSLFEQLCGHNPLADQRVAIEVDASLRWVAPPERDVPGRLLRVLRRGLQDDPDARFPDMPALLAALRQQRSRRGWGAGALGLGVVLGGFALWGATPSVTCDGATSLATAWNDASRTAVSEALAQSGSAYAETVAASTTALLDGYARAWVEEDDAACRTEVKRPKASTQRACLRRQRRRFEALVGALQEIDEAGARRAVDAAGALPEPSACASGSAAPAPEGSKQQDLDERLDALEVAVRLRADAQAHALVDALQTEPLETPDLRARFELLAAMHTFDHDDSDEALRHYDEALVAALEADDDRLLAGVAVQLSIALGDRDRPREAERTFRIARIAAEDADPPVGLRLRIAAAEAGVLSNGGRAKEAVGVLKDAVALAEAELGAEHPTTLRMLDNLTVPLGRLGRHDEALVANARAMDIARRVEGERHPTMAGLLESRASILFGSGRVRDSLVPFRTALAIRVETAPTASSTVRLTADLSSALLTIAADRGSDGSERDEALALLEPLAEALEAAGRIDEPGNARLWGNLGSIYMRRDRIEEGRALIQRSVSILEASHGPTSLYLGPGLTQLASAEVKLGAFGQAREHVARARRIAIDNDAGAGNIVRVELLQGMIERDAGEIDEARRILAGAIDRAREAGATTLVERGQRALDELDTLE